MRYSADYYSSIERSAESSSRVLVPLILELIKPQSVLDVGCGDGTWLNAYAQTGLVDYQGVDGDYVSDDVLKIPRDHFTAQNLEHPFDLGRRFDLVQSLEVAEHLSANAAKGFVQSLVRHGDVILFSAAVPSQRGQDHINEQWPDYWAALFELNGFDCFDWIRPRVWADNRVAWWYAQNTLLFVKKTHEASWLAQMPPPSPVGPKLRIVHPHNYLAACSRANIPEDVLVNSRMPKSSAILTQSSGPTRGGPYNVAVIIPTIGRSSLGKAIRSVYAQQFEGTIQILVGVDIQQGDPELLSSLIHAAPPNCFVSVIDPGYSTASRHGGLYLAATGGSLRTIMSYLAHSRFVAYLDDDNWWGPDHLSTLIRAIDGKDWAYSLRWFVDSATEEPLVVDTWESVGPGAGVFNDRFGGFVDPSCLLIDKIACEPALRLWCQPLPDDPSGTSTDRAVFDYLRQHGRYAGTGLATAFYTLQESDVNHAVRMEQIERVRMSLKSPLRPTTG